MEVPYFTVVLFYFTCYFRKRVEKSTISIFYCAIIKMHSEMEVYS